MKHLYAVVFIVSFLTNLKSQVFHAINFPGPYFWEEKFETMSVLNQPTGGWLTNPGGFSVQANPHQEEGFQALSKEFISLNPGVDSVLTPFITKAGSPFDIRFRMRITDWIGSVPSNSAFTMPVGDTCYFSVVKYKNYAPISETIIYKRFGYSSTIGYEYISRPTNLYMVSTDTIRFKIKATHGTSSNYWIDLDYFIFVVPVNIEERTVENPSCFPNPVSENLYLKLSANDQLETLLIKNELGEVVFLQDKFDKMDTQLLNFNLLPQGLYFAEISLRNGKKTAQKIIKD